MSIESLSFANGSRLAELRVSWRTLLGCTLGAAVSPVGLVYYSSGLFFAALTAELGWTTGQLSLVYAITTCGVMLGAPLAGAIADRHGAWPVIAFSLAVVVSGFAALGVLPANLLSFLLVQALLAFLGAGAAPPSYARVVALRFRVLRGTALGIMVAGVGILAIVLPVSLAAIISARGWRVGYLALAALVAAAGTTALLLLRSRPNPTNVAKNAVQTRAVAEGDAGWQVLRRREFWILVAGFAPPAIFLAGYPIHLVPLLGLQGFGMAEAAAVQSTIGIAVLLGRLGSGMLLDRFFGPHVAAAIFTVSAVGCALLATFEPRMVWVAAFAIGLGVGAELDLVAYMTAYYFGTQRFGRLFGAMYGGIVALAGLSPLAISLLVDTLGDYRRALLVCAAALMLGVIALVAAPRRSLDRDESLPAEPLDAR